MRIGSGQLLRISPKVIGIIVLLTGGVLIVAPSALGYSSRDPMAAFWDAIYDLQKRDDNLQSQIDDLRATANTQSVAGLDILESDPSLSTKIENGEVHGEIILSMNVTNNGPDRAAGVRLTAFYKMSLFHIESIMNESCTDLSRGIIQCDLGTIEAGNESVVSMVVMALSSEDTTLTVDLTSTTKDADPTNNRNVLEFTVTRSGISGLESGDSIHNRDVAENKDGSGSNNQGDNSEAQDSSSSSDESDDQNSPSNSNQTSSSSPEAGSNATDSSSSESQGSSSENQTSSSTQDTSSSDDNGADKNSDEGEQQQNASSGNQTSAG
jgi:hypothetical protein